MLIADSSFLISFYDEGDSNHDKAVKLMKECQDDKLVISDYIVGETATVLLYKHSKEAALNFLGRLKETESIQLFIFSESDFFGAIDVFKSQKYELSLIDASVVYLSTVFNSKVLSFDENILKAMNR